MLDANLLTASVRNGAFEIMTAKERFKRGLKTVKQREGREEVADLNQHPSLLQKALLIYIFLLFI